MTETPSSSLNLSSRVTALEMLLNELTLRVAASESDHNIVRAEIDAFFGPSRSQVRLQEDGHHVRLGDEGPLTEVGRLPKIPVTRSLFDLDKSALVANVLQFYGPIPDDESAFASDTRFGYVHGSNFNEKNVTLFSDLVYNMLMAKDYERFPLYISRWKDYARGIDQTQKDAAVLNRVPFFHLVHLTRTTGFGYDAFLALAALAGLRKNIWLCVEGWECLAATGDAMFPNVVSSATPWTLMDRQKDMNIILRKTAEILERSKTDAMARTFTGTKSLRDDAMRNGLRAPWVIEHKMSIAQSLHNELRHLLAQQILHTDIAFLFVAILGHCIGADDDPAEKGHFYTLTLLATGSQEHKSAHELEIQAACNYAHWLICVLRNQRSR